MIREAAFADQALAVGGYADFKRTLHALASAVSTIYSRSRCRPAGADRSWRCKIQECGHCRIPSHYR
jgi:hypothetical protein